jgi:hypothetical protein
LPVLIVLSTSIIIHYRVLYGKLESNSKVAAYGTLVTNHQHDSMGFSKDRQPLSDRITLAETKQVVIEKHHPDNLRAVFSIFKLRQDHRCQFEGAGHVGGKDVGNFHETCIFIGVSF